MVLQSNDELTSRLRRRGGRWGVRSLRLALALADIEGTAMLPLAVACEAIERYGVQGVYPQMLLDWCVHNDVNLQVSAAAAAAESSRRASTSSSLSSSRPGSGGGAAMWRTTTQSALSAPQTKQENTQRFAKTGQASVLTPSTTKTGTQRLRPDDVCVGTFQLMDAVTGVATPGGGIGSKRLQAISKAYQYCVRLHKAQGGLSAGKLGAGATVSSGFRTSRPSSAGGGSGHAAADGPTMKWMCSELDWTQHPDVLEAKISINDAIWCFYCAWGVGEDQPVTQTLFEQFWSDWSPAFASDDEFVTMVAALHRHYGRGTAAAAADEGLISSAKPLVVDKAEAEKIFHQIDVNRNGTLSLAELDLAVIRLWPHFNNKPAIMRAYKLADKSGNGWLDKGEFLSFLKFLSVYGTLFQRFQQVDEDRSGSIDLAELKKHKKVLGLGQESDVALRAIFKSIDVNGGGKILFEELCVYIAKREGKKEFSTVTNSF